MDGTLEGLVGNDAISSASSAADAASSGGGGACSGGNFFQIPHWYEYLTCNGTQIQLPAGPAGPDGKPTPDVFAAIPPIGLAILDIALHIAGMVAIFFVVYGAIEYVVSQGEPDKVTKARGTIINALVGMTIAIFSIAVVKFLGQKLGASS